MLMSEGTRDGSGDGLVLRPLHGGTVPATADGEEHGLIQRATTWGSGRGWSVRVQALRSTTGSVSPGPGAPQCDRGTRGSGTIIPMFLTKDGKPVGPSASWRVHAAPGHLQVVSNVVDWDEQRRWTPRAGSGRRMVTVEPGSRHRRHSPFGPWDTRWFQVAPTLWQGDHLEN